MISGKNLPNPLTLSKVTGHCSISSISINDSETDGISSINISNKKKPCQCFSLEGKASLRQPWRLTLAALFWRKTTFKKNRFHVLFTMMGQRSLCVVCGFSRQLSVQLWLGNACASHQRIQQTVTFMIIFSSHFFPSGCMRNESSSNTSPFCCWCRILNTDFYSAKSISTSL